jgi:predicted transposase YdaD
MREIAMSDYTSGINHAIRQGIAIGEEKGVTRGVARGIAIGEQRGEQRGEQKALVKYVLKLSQKGMAVGEIAEWTDLPVQEVTGILKLREAL